MSSSRLLRVALLGDFAGPEFAAARELIAASAQVHDFSESAKLLAGKDATAASELVVVAQARPRQWDGPWLDALRRTWPLVRVVAILGTWCEGETRTGQPLAADVRVFWYRFGVWWPRQMELLASGRAAQWSNHGTHGLHGQEQGEVANGDESEKRGLVLIAARDRDSAESIALACQLGGWAAVWVRPPSPLPIVHGATAILYDGGPLGDRDLAAIDRLRAAYGPLPVVAFADLPTIDRLEAAKDVGVRAILGKPFYVDDLHAELTCECRISRKED